MYSAIQQAWHAPHWRSALALAYSSGVTPHSFPLISKGNCNHHRAASRERARARMRSNCSWKEYRHGAGLEPPNGCAHRSRASAHLSEQMQSFGAVARVQINGTTRVAQSSHMPRSINVLIKSTDPKKGPALRLALRRRQLSISTISSWRASGTALRIADCLIAHDTF